MSAAAELATRLRLSDPKPSHCSACFRAAEAGVRFVDFDAASDRGVILGGDAGAVVGSLDWLHLCEDCVRQAGEVLAFKPQAHRRQLQAIRTLENTVGYWQDRAKRAETDGRGLSKRIEELEVELGQRELERKNR